LNTSLGLALLAGIGIAAACGLRAFLPLLALGIASRLGLIELEPHARWLAEPAALLGLGTATVLEIVGDKVPVVDHALDVAGTFVRPLAAWFGAYALFIHWPTPWGQVAALLLGTGALAVQVAKAKLRLGSTVMTLGHVNPLISIAEDGTALLLVVIALLVPVIVLAVLAIIVAVLRIARARSRRAVA
jgi:hypothetical protein